MKSLLHQKGFTLLELLLVVVSLGILIALVLVLVEPDIILERFDNAGYEADARSLENALRQYNLEQRRYPDDIGFIPVPICNTGTLTPTDPLPDGVDCTDYVDLRALVPEYIAAIPSGLLISQSESGFTVQLDENRQVNVGVQSQDVALERRQQVYLNDVSQVIPVSWQMQPQEGSLLVVAISHRISKTDPVITGDGWNKVVDTCWGTGMGECTEQGELSSRRGWGIFWKIAGSSEPSTLGYSWTNEELETYGNTLVMQEFSVSGGKTFQYEGANDVLSQNELVTSLSSNVLNSTPINTLLLGFVFVKDASGPITQWSGVTSANQIGNSSSHISLFSTYELMTNFGSREVGATWTTPQWANLAAVAFSIK